MLTPVRAQPPLRATMTLCAAAVVFARTRPLRDVVELHLDTVKLTDS